MTHLKKTIAVLILILGFAAFACGCGDESGGQEPEAGSEIEAAVPGLSDFIGGWGFIGEGDLQVVSLFDEQGKLRVDFAEVPGGGYYVTFDAADISVEGDTLRCANGKVVTDGGPTGEEAKLLVKPVAEGSEAYVFELNYYDTFIEQYHEESVACAKVGDSQAELDAWISEHDPLMQ